jgi:hypothetical protein
LSLVTQSVLQVSSEYAEDEHLRSTIRRGRKNLIGVEVEMLDPTGVPDHSTFPIHIRDVLLILNDR